MRICYVGKCYTLRCSFTMQEDDPVLQTLADKLNCSTKEIIDALTSKDE